VYGLIFRRVIFENDGKDSFAEAFMISKIICLALLGAMAVDCGNGKSELVFQENGRIQTHSVEPTFASINKFIIQQKCMPCHGKGADSPHGLDFTTYENVTNQALFPPVIEPGNPGGSDFYRSIAEGRMPQDREKLSAQEIRAVFEWIKAGAKP
jgi:hypothetical protein